MDEIQEHVNAVMETVVDTIRNLRLRLAVEKTVVLTRRYGGVDPLEVYF